MMRRTVLSNEFLSSFFMELSLFLHAGIGTSDGLHLLIGESADQDTDALLHALADRMDAGVPLSQAMRETGRFPTYPVTMAGVGEQTGRPEETLRALSDYYESREQLNRHIRNALLYPAVLLVLMLVVIVILLAKVLPVFNQVFLSLGGEMTGVAGGLLTLGSALDAVMPVLCAILALAVVLLAAFAGSDRFRDRLMNRWRARHGERGIARSVATARFARVLSMGMQSALPAEDSIRMAEELYEDIPSEKRRIHDCLSRLDQGDSLASALQKSEVLPAASCRMLALGIRSGSGDAVMEEIARRLQSASEQRIEETVGRVEPTMVIVTSILVGLILLSVMLPLMNIMAAIG